MSYNNSKPPRWHHVAIVFLFCLLSLGHVSFVLSESTDADNDLFDALAAQDVDAADAALKAGANINVLSPKGQQTPLMQSVLHGRTKMVKWCLENGADVTIPERDGYTPMHGAGFQGHAEIAALLFEHGVGLRDVHEDGYEPASESSFCCGWFYVKGIIHSILLPISPVRSCWGPEARHSDAVAWFLDNGTPLDAIYDVCMQMSKNEGTRAMLQQRKGAVDEL